MVDTVDTKMMVTHLLLWRSPGAVIPKEDELAWKGIYYNMLYQYYNILTFTKWLLESTFTSVTLFNPGNIISSVNMLLYIIIISGDILQIKNLGLITSCVICNSNFFKML